MQFKTLLFIFLYCTISCLLRQISGAGTGQNLIWAQDTELALESRDEQKDTLFDPFELDVINEIKEQFGQVLDGLHIELVAPNSQLLTMMNRLSTNSKVMFLKDYDHYFKQLNVGSTDRPMLSAYLGLQLTGQERIAAWYKPHRARSGRRIIESCKSLIKIRNSSINLSDSKLAKLDDCKQNVANKFYLAYLTFKQNLNLFMMDQYLTLCSKLEPEALEKDLFTVHLAF